MCSQSDLAGRPIERRPTNDCLFGLAGSAGSLGSLGSPGSPGSPGRAGQAGQAGDTLAQVSYAWLASPPAPAPPPWPPCRPIQLAGRVRHCHVAGAPVGRRAPASLAANGRAIQVR